MAARTAQVFGPMAPINDILPNNVATPFDYEMVYIPGAAQGNALFNAAEAEAALAQTQEEHNDALNKYLTAMQYPPAVREMMGKQIEKNLVKGGGQYYEYRGGNTVQEAAQEVLKLLRGGSLGRNLNTKIAGSWGAAHKI